MSTSDPTAVCELNNVSKRYGSRTVLDKFSLQIGNGEMVAITGKSGIGKTTILNLLGLLEKPDTGEVCLFGHRNPRIGSRQSTRLLRTHIGYLFQNSALIDGSSVSANLDIALAYMKVRRAKRTALKVRALNEVGLGADTLRQKVYSLSGGEQQRVAIARLMLKPCRLILADEPTGSLDAANQRDIIDILRKMNRDGKSIVIVTHNAFVADACDRQVQLGHE